MLNTKTKRWVRITVFLGAVITVGFLAIRTPAQNNSQERAASLRSQLVEAQARQAELQTRLQQLEEDLKPENIERSLADVGSVHPEELREARRRKLEIEKRGLQSQLDVLAASRTRLEAAIARADAESYWQSAGLSAKTESANNLARANKLTLRAKQRIKGRRSIKRY